MFLSRKLKAFKSNMYYNSQLENVFLSHVKCYRDIRCTVTELRIS